MANRLILLLSVVLTGVALGASSARAAPADDECLARPKGVAPAGKHWYYRTNREIQRKCWYLGDEGAPTVAAAPRKQPVSAAPVEPAAKIDVQPPGANARAELIDEPTNEQPTASATSPLAQPEVQPQVQSQVQSAPEDTTPRNWTVASRWPDPSSFAADPAATVGNSARVARNENPSPALAAEPIQQPSAAINAVVDNTEGVSFGQIAASLIVIVVVGGTIFMSFAARRQKSRLTQDDMHGHEMPWTRHAAANAAVIGEPEQRRLGDEIEELDRLLTIARDARASEIGIAGKPA